MKPLRLISFFLMAGSATTLPVSTAKPATLPAQVSKQTKPTTRQAPAPVIMPGTRLDKNFNALPAQNSAVNKAAPAWLRAKANGSPVYVVDGNVATAAQLRALRQTNVASVKVLEGSKAATFYGKNARNGMVLITTKKGLAPIR